MITRKQVWRYVRALLAPDRPLLLEQALLADLGELAGQELAERGVHAASSRGGI